MATRNHDDAPLPRSAIWWRAFLLVLCALGIVLLLQDVAADHGHIAVNGLGLASTDKPYLLKVTSVSRTALAAHSGVKVGDLLDLRPMSAPDRYRLFGSSYCCRSIEVYIVRRNALERVVVRTYAIHSFTWDVWFGYGGAIWMLFFASILVVRLPERRDARTLALVLIASAFQAALVNNLTTSDWLTPWPAIDAGASALSCLCLLCFPLLATYAMSFAQPASRARRVFLQASYASAALTTVMGIASVVCQWTGVFNPLGAVFTSSWALLAYSLVFVFPVLCGLATAVEAHGMERTRFLWAFVPISLFYIAAMLDSIDPAFWPNFGVYTNGLVNITSFLAPLGLTYSLLNRRLLDVGFALNRAAIFSGVSIVLVGTFVLVEWLLSDWLQRESHSTNIIVSAGVALALGLSIRFFHGKVEHFVDHVMFRRRREDEEAIYRMAREAPYITDRATLLARTERVLNVHSDASFVQLLLDEENGRYGSVDENDPAIVSLRAEHAPVDLHAVETSLEGEWAYPMVARGRLIGALVLGPKRSQESYAPDESQAIAQLAHSVGGALDVLTIEHDDTDLASAVRELPERIVSRLMHAMNGSEANTQQ